MDVALGLGRELGVQTRVLVAPLSFGPHQLEGPVAQVIASILSGQGYPKTLSKSHWRMIYGPDLGQRVVRFLTQPTEGSVIRLPGLHETSWKQLTLMIEQLLERFVQTNPALKTRFPEANWTRRLSDHEAHHPGWPEIVMSGRGAIEKPETAWPKALADTLRWYLTEPNLWESRISVLKSPALIN
jgi:nucleoside-diphosphate-sugar epimerase